MLGQKPTNQQAFLFGIVRNQNHVVRSHATSYARCWQSFSRHLLFFRVNRAFSHRDREPSLSKFTLRTEPLVPGSESGVARSREIVVGRTGSRYLGQCETETSRRRRLRALKSIPRQIPRQAGRLEPTATSPAERESEKNRKEKNGATIFKRPAVECWVQSLVRSVGQFLPLAADFHPG